MTRRIEAVLLDRDGVINLEGGHVRCENDFKILPGVGEAIRILNENEIKVALVTNQSGIARGYLSVEGLRKIHAKLTNYLSAEEAKIDAIYVSPWLNEPGLVGGDDRYLRAHFDRKPRPGMLLKALEKFGVSCESACLVGDSGRDEKAAAAANVKFFGVVSSKIAELSDECVIFGSLSEFVVWLEARAFRL